MSEQVTSKDQLRECEDGPSFPEAMPADISPVTHQEIISAVHHHASEIARLTVAWPVGDSERRFTEKDVAAMVAAVRAIDAEKRRAVSEPETSHNALVRELDVLLNGEHRAAPQASLCDIVAQVKRERLSLWKGDNPSHALPPSACLCDESLALLRKMRDEHIERGSLSGRLQHEAEELLQRLAQRPVPTKRASRFCEMEDCEQDRAIGGVYCPAHEAKGERGE